MKLITLNKLNRLWKNGVVAKMIAKTKVLTTMEQVKANTNAENVTSAIVTKELYNNLNAKLAQGRVQLVVQSDGTLGYKLDGADTVHPFSTKLTIPTMGGGNGTNAVAQFSESINISKYKKLTLGSVSCTGSYAYVQINRDGEGLASFGTGTNRTNVVYDITDYNQISFVFTCQAGNASIKNVVFE